MANPDDVEIVIDGDDPPTGKPAKAEAAKPAAQVKDDEIKVVNAEDAPKVIAPDEGIELLKANLKRSEDARIEAERQAHEARQQATTATTEVQDSRLQLITTAMETVKQSNEALRAKYREARINNDPDAEWEINQELSKNAAKMIQLEAGKASLERRAKEPPPVARPADPVEAMAAQLTPRSAAWVRSNPDYARDPRKTQEMIAAHNLALARGHTADSDSYFETVEKILELRKQEPVVQHEEATAAAAKASGGRQTAPPAAPVSRSGSGDGKRPNTVTLTKEQREIAEAIGITAKEYAMNLVALKAEGRMQ